RGADVRAPGLHGDEPLDRPGGGARGGAADEPGAPDAGHAGGDPERAAGGVRRDRGGDAAGVRAGENSILPRGRRHPRRAALLLPELSTTPVRGVVISRRAAPATEPQRE